MMNADNKDRAEQGVAISLLVDEATGTVELEINAKQETNAAAQDLPTSPPPEKGGLKGKNHLINTFENSQKIHSHQNSSQQPNRGHDSETESPCLAHSDPTQLQDTMQAVTDQETNVALTEKDVHREAQIPLPTYCPSCGVNLHSTSASIASKPKTIKTVPCFKNSKTVEERLVDVMEDKRQSFTPMDYTHRHRYFFEGTRSETLRDVKQVAVDGTEALKNRLRLAVLRENEIRMEAEMSQADKEIANIEKVLAEILLKDTRQHEAMLQKDLQSAVVELQRPNQRAETFSTTDGLLREKFKALKAEVNTERRRREEFEAEMCSMMKEFQNEKPTKNYVSRLEAEIRHLKEERQRSGNALDDQRELWRANMAYDLNHPVQERIPYSREKDCWYSMDNRRGRDVGYPNEWQGEMSHLRDKRCPSRNRRHPVLSNNRNQLRKTPASSRGQYKRSRTSSMDELDAQFECKAEGQRAIPFEKEYSKQASKRNEYIPPVPPTKVDSEALRKARQDYMKETRRMQDRWHTISQER